MRISDWSSDVCSSDLVARYFPFALDIDAVHSGAPRIADRGEHAVQVEDLQIAVAIVKERRVQAQPVVEQLGLNPQLEGIDLLRAVGIGGQRLLGVETARSEEHTSELQSLMRISYAVFCLKKKHNNTWN